MTHRLYTLLLLFFISLMMIEAENLYVYGVKPIEWKYNAYGNYAAWEEGCGWYDCDKVLDEEDSNLCWAAATANVLHWWFDQNKKNIDDYGKYKGPENIYRNCPAEGVDRKEAAVGMSSFFDWYKKGYTNTGGSVHVAFEHFITTKTTEKRGGAYLVEIFPEQNDYFVEIASENATRYGGVKKQKLAEIIRTAIKNKQAICMSFKQGGAGHAVTVWGAEFDDEGFVKNLFICDNNFDYEGDINSTPVVYDSDNWAYIRSTNFKINYFSLLSLGDENWASYFAKITTELRGLKSSEDPAIYASHKQLVLKNHQGPVSIYSTSGQLVFHKAHTDLTENIPIATSGIYFVKTANETTKIIIK